MQYDIGMLWPVLALILVGLAISVPLCAMLVRTGHHLGALDSGGAAGHAKQLRRVPNIGGIAITIAIVLPLAAGLLAVNALDEVTLTGWLPVLASHLDRIADTTPTVIGLLAGMLILHITGLVDDRRPLGPWSKLAIQVVVAACMVVFFDVRLLTALDRWIGVGPAPSMIVTILWIVLITNAINFLDNMDGLAAGVCAVAGIMFMIATLLNAQWFIAATLALMIGALVGFLLFNRPPARLFMGDGGSLVIGFLLAVLTARTTYYNPGEPHYALGGGWYGVFMPVIVLAIPIYDFLTVTMIRLRQGRSPFVGDQQHFSHRLVQRGLSKRGAVFVIWALTAVTGISGIALGSLQPWQAALVGLQTVLVLLTIALLEHASRRSAPREPARDQRS